MKKIIFILLIIAAVQGCLGVTVYSSIKNCLSYEIVILDVSGKKYHLLKPKESLNFFIPAGDIIVFDEIGNSHKIYIDIYFEKKHRSPFYLLYTEIADCYLYEKDGKIFLLYSDPYDDT